MISHAVILTSVRRAFPFRLLDKPDVERVTVVAEAGHRHPFPLPRRGAGPQVSVLEVDDIRDTTQVLRAVRRAGADHTIDRVLSPVEFGVATAGFLRSALGLPGESFDVALAFSDKYLMKQRLEQAGIPTARYRQAFSPRHVVATATQLGWPLIVKPMFGGACLDVVRLDTPQAAQHWAGRDGAARLAAAEMPLCVEEFIEMTAEFHVDAVLKDGEAIFSTVSKYLDPLLGRIDDFDGSWVLPPDHPDREKALTVALAAVHALGLRDGVTHVELFQSPDGFRVGEAACRPPGGGIPEAIAYHHGVDLWDAYWAVALGLQPTMEPTPPDGIVVNVNLPIRSGLITSLSTEEELRAACPGLIELRMTMSPGDVVPQELNSSSATGTVFFRAADEAAITSTVAALRSAYRLEVHQHA